MKKLLAKFRKLKMRWEVYFDTDIHPDENRIEEYSA